MRDLAAKRAAEVTFQLDRLSDGKYRAMAIDCIAALPDGFTRSRLSKLSLAELRTNEVMRQLVYAEVKARQQHRASEFDEMG